MRLDLCLTGRIVAHTDSGSVDEELLGGRRGRTAFAMLVLEHARGVSREELADAIWPAEVPPTWESAVRAAVSRVRHFLAATGLEGEAVTSASGCYQVHLPEQATLDLELAEQDVRAAAVLLRDGQPGLAAKRASSARAVLRRPFLVGLEGVWVQAKRTALQSLLVEGLETLSAAHSAVGEHGLAIAAADEAVAAEPFRETSHRRLMAAHAAAGDRAAALRAYARCRRLLAEELGIEPSAETERAYVALLGEEHPAVTTSAPSPSGALPPALTRVSRGPFVGRVSQLRGLSAPAGDRHLVLVTGEAGIGKTRLVAESAAQTHAEGATILFGRCSEDAPIAYQPLVEALGGWFRSVPAGELDQVAGPFAPELSRLVPDLAERLPGRVAAGASRPETERFRIFESVRGCLDALSAQRPMRLVIDDLQWVQPATVALLSHLLCADDPAPLVVVATCRPDGLSDNNALAGLLEVLRRHRLVTSLPLGGLSGDDVEDLMAALASKPLDQTARQVASRIHLETSGNAFFATEMVTYLLETGTVVLRPDGRWVVARPLAGAGVPPAMRDVVVGRLNRLPATVTDTLQIASVAGRTFEVGLLCDLSRSGEDGVLDDLDAATQSGLVSSHGGADRYSFSHDVVQAVVYGELSPARRHRYHHRVAMWLAGRPDADARANELAHHFTESLPLGEAAREQAIAWHRRAGEQAAGSLAFEQAASHFGDALSLLAGGSDPGTVGGPALRAVDLGLRCDLRTALGDAWHRVDDPRHRGALMNAAGDARELDDPLRLARVALAWSRSGWTHNFGERDSELVAVLEESITGLGDSEPALRAELMARLAVEVSWDPDPETAAGLSAAAVDLARSLDDASLLVRVLGAARFAPRSPDRLAGRVAHARELIDLSGEVGSLDGLAHGNVMLCDALMESGDVSGAVAAIARADQAARRIGQPAYGIAVLLRRIGVASARGRLEEAEALAQTWARLASAGGMAPSALAVQYQAALLAVRVEQGRMAELQPPLDAAYARSAPLHSHAAAAHRLADSGDLTGAGLRFEILMEAGLDKVPADAFWLHTMVQAAMGCALLGRTGEAREIRRRLAPFPGRLAWTMLSCTGPSDLALAMLDALLGCRSEAQEHFRRAVALCEAGGVLCWLARARLRWASSLAGSAHPQDRDHARSLARKAHSVAVEVGMPVVAEQAAALVSTL